MGRGPASVSICYLGLGNPEDLTPARTVIYLADAPEFLKLSTATQEFQWSLGSFVASASKAAFISAAVIERGTVRRGCCPGLVLAYANCFAAPEGQQRGPTPRQGAPPACGARKQ